MQTTEQPKTSWTEPEVVASIPVMAAKELLKREGWVEQEGQWVSPSNTRCWHLNDAVELAITDMVR